MHDRLEEKYLLYKTSNVNADKIINYRYTLTQFVILLNVSPQAKNFPLKLWKKIDSCSACYIIYDSRIILLEVFNLNIFANVINTHPLFEHKINKSHFDLFLM